MFDQSSDRAKFCISIGPNSHFRRFLSINMNFLQFINAFQNLLNIYEPAHSSLTGVLAVNNFANPITFICGVSRSGIHAAAATSGSSRSSDNCASSGSLASL